jgi:hypothetical protein
MAPLRATTMAAVKIGTVTLYLQPTTMAGKAHYKQSHIDYKIL